MTHPKKYLPLQWQKLIALACCWLAAALSTQAQTTGTIRGRVFNPATKEYVNNAEVRLEGTNQVTFSEQDGSFQFGGVPAGATTLVINYTGYSQAKDSFTVTAGQTAVREISITSTANTAPATTQGWRGATPGLQRLHPARR
jgi:iron complex outermembrane receptor protein